MKKFILNPLDSSEEKKTSYLLKKIFNKMDSFFNIGFQYESNQLQKIFQEYKLTMGETPSEIMNQILEVIHLEQIKKKKLEIIPYIPENVHYNYYDRQSTFSNFINENIKKNKSKIADIFSIVEETRKQIPNDIRGMMYFYSSYYIYNINLSFIFNHYLTNHTNNPQYLSLLDCINILSETRNVTYGYMNCFEQHYIYSTPPCIIFSLNRYFNELFFTNQILYDNILDLSSVTLLKECNHKYQLVSVIKEKPDTITKNKSNLDEIRDAIIHKKTLNQKYLTFIIEGDDIYYYEGNTKVKNPENNLADEYYPILLVYTYQCSN